MNEVSDMTCKLDSQQAGSLALGRIEVCQKSTSSARQDEIKRRIREQLSELFALERFYDCKICKFSDAFLIEHIDSVSLCDIGMDLEASDLVRLNIYVYQLHDTDVAMEELDDEENISAGNHWILPSFHFEGLWESLVYDEDIKHNLLQYARTSLLFSDKKVDVNIVSWNRLILVHGPPGTGKTSLCKALAHKLSIVLSERYRHGQLIEINSHSLFSKWFSESGKLVMKMFQKIQDFVSDPEAFVCVLIDEVESLSASRQCMSGNEPSDAIRVVNALLTQLDAIKRYPNVVVLTTSNITNAIDDAFLDRADIRQYIGLPSVDGIYQILYSCVMELIRAGIILNYETLVDLRFLRVVQSMPLTADQTCAIQRSLDLQQIAIASVGLSGRSLRKLPFIAHSIYVQTPTETLERFLEAMMKATKRLLSDQLTGRPTTVPL